MIWRPFTLRSSLLLTILMIGVVALGLILLSGYIFLNLVYESERNALTGLIDSKVTDHIEKLEAKSRELTASIQLLPILRQMGEQADMQNIGEALDDQFRRYFVTAGVIKLQKIFVLDINYNIIAWSSRGIAFTRGGKMPCPGLLGLARNRSHSERIKPVGQACLQDGVPHYAMIAPIGTFRPKAYLLLVTDPVFELTAIEHDMRIPLRITLPNGKPAYQSEHWPGQGQIHHYLSVSYTYRDTAAEPIAVISMARDLTGFHKSIVNTASYVGT